MHTKLEAGLIGNFSTLNKDCFIVFSFMKYYHQSMAQWRFLILSACYLSLLICVFLRHARALKEISYPICMVTSAVHYSMRNVLAIMYYSERAKEKTKIHLPRDNKTWKGETRSRKFILISPKSYTSRQAILPSSNHF